MSANRGRGLRPTALLAGVSLALTIAPAGASTWQVARGPSAVSFRVSHLVFSEVRGRFTRFGGSVELPGDDLEAARVVADIEAASIRTGHEDRDRHLRSDDFLSAAAFPRMRFVSRRIRRTAEDRFEIIGALTIRGITREIVLTATSMGRRETSAGPRLDFLAAGALDRREYDLTWNRIWDNRALIGDEVTIELKICLVKAP